MCDPPSRLPLCCKGHKNLGAPAEPWTSTATSIQQGDVSPVGSTAQMSTCLCGSVLFASPTSITLGRHPQARPFINLGNTNWEASGVSAHSRLQSKMWSVEAPDGQGRILKGREPVILLGSLTVCIVLSYLSRPTMLKNYDKMVTTTALPKAMISSWWFMCISSYPHRGLSKVNILKIFSKFESWSS